jgi:hypothetical protein
MGANWLRWWQLLRIIEEEMDSRYESGECTEDDDRIIKVVKKDIRLASDTMHDMLTAVERNALRG